jgi:hypothetical protein
MAAPYFRASVMTFLMPRSAITLPIGQDGCQMENDARKIFGA